MHDIDYFQHRQQNIDLALEEDIATGDITAELIPETTRATATIICREEATLCGRPWFDLAFKTVSQAIEIEWFYEEGDQIKADTLVCTLKGNARALLTAERTGLNFLQLLSGTATTTSHYVKALDSKTTQLLDTRKTLPSLRLAQKYAVKVGGGQNHRIGLYDAILLKENHIMSSGGILNAVTTAKKNHPSKTVEVETETLAEVEQALKAGADIIMLDNFSLEMMHQAVSMNQHSPNTAKLEVSGNVEIEQLAAIAATGVDFISTGAITKHLRAIDFSMRFSLET